MTKSDTNNIAASSAGNAALNHKKAAVQFLEMVVSGKIDEAYSKYIDMDGKHHNPYFPAGFPALRDAMKEDQVNSPNKRFTIRHVIGDGDLVAVHSHVEMHPGEPGYETVHIFRFENDRVVELWDCVQAIPSDSPNKDGIF